MQIGAGIMEVPLELKIELSYDLAILLLGIYTKEIKAVARRDIRAPCSLQHYSQ